MPPLVALALLLAVEPGADEKAPSAPKETVLDLRPQVVIDEFLYQGPFERVSSVYCDPRSGEVYVADAAQSTIGIFDARGVPLFAFSDSQHLSSPTRVTVDGEGRIHVIDADRKRIKVFSYRGEFLSYVDVGALAGQDVYLTAMALDEQGNLYVGDSSIGQVLLLDRARRLKERFGAQGTGKGEFTAIASIALDQDHVYVADRVAFGVQVFSRHGRFVAGWGVHQIGRPNVSLPAGIAVDQRGRIVLVDTLRHEIKYFEADGTLVDLFGGIGSSPGDVAYPVDVSIGQGGVVCVADQGNRRVQLLKPVEGVPALAPRATSRAAGNRPRATLP